jgi:hypothetical protein
MHEDRPTLASGAGSVPSVSEALELGAALSIREAGIKDNPRGLWEAKGWKELVGHMPEHKARYAAVMLENCRRKYGAMDESTRTSNLGSFDKWIFPIIANMSENDIIDQLVSLQPMPGPTSQIVYMDIVTSQAKGNVPAGSPMWQALAGATDRYTDSSEVVDSESISTTNGSGAASGTLAYTPVRAGTVVVTVGSGVAQDDGNGVLAGSFTGTINYVTGAISVAGAANTTEALATYAYNSEGNSNLQGLELKLTSAPVTAQVYKLKTNWTEEADQNLQAMYNIKAESVLLNAITGALQYQKNRTVINDIRGRANAGVVTWDAVPDTNVSYQTHKLSIIDGITTLSNFIFRATNRVRGNWLLVGMQALTVIETLPQFVSKGSATAQGIQYVGDLTGLKVYADPHYPVDEFLMGYKGDSWVETGYVLAEYQKLYTTPNYMLTDFVNSKGFATSFAKKCVNSKMFGRGFVTNAYTNY